MSDDQEESNVTSFRQARLERAAPDLSIIIDLLRKHGLDDGLPVQISLSGEPYILLFGKLQTAPKKL